MRVMVLDDKKICSSQIELYVQMHYRDWQVMVYTTPFSLVTAIYDEYHGEADLLMVHIACENDENILMSRDLQDFFPHIHIVFFSEYTDCAEAIFRAKPLYFLKVPLCEERLEDAFERAVRELQTDIKQTITIYHRGQMIRIRFFSIRYMESVGRKMVFYTDNGSYETYMTMKEAALKLPEYIVRCHRSFMINLNRVEQRTASTIRLTSKETIPVSRSFQNEIKEIMEQRQK